MSQKIPNNSLDTNYVVKSSAILEFDSSKKNVGYLCWDKTFGYFRTTFKLLRDNDKEPDKTVMRDFGMYTIHNTNTNNKVCFVFSHLKRDEFGDVQMEVWESVDVRMDKVKWKLIILNDE